MGRRGPPPKPTKLKLLEGTFRKDRVAPDEFTPAPGEPECPQQVRKNPLALAQWKRVVTELVDKNVLAKVDVAHLHGYCVAYAAAELAQARYDKKPEVKTPFGPKTNPAYSEAIKWWEKVRAFGNDLGLSPSARTRGSMQPKEEPKQKDPLAKFRLGGA